MLVWTSVLISKVGERGDHPHAPSCCGSSACIIQDQLCLVTTDRLPNKLQDQAGVPQACVITSPYVVENLVSSKTERHLVSCDCFSLCVASDGGWPQRDAVDAEALRR